MTETENEQAIPFTPIAFKQAMSTFATGVAVITTRYQEKPIGVTVSAFSSLSLNPPLVLVCLDKKLFTHEAVAQSGIFAINILSAAQVEWGKRFAGLLPDIKDRFEGIAYETAQTGAPILPGVMAWVDCRLYQRYEGGDHTIFVGEVLAVNASGQEHSLLYYRRGWHQPAEIEPHSI